MPTAVRADSRHADSHLTDAEFTGMARALRDRMAIASIKSSPMMVAIYRDAAATLQRPRAFAVR